MSNVTESMKTSLVTILRAMLPCIGGKVVEAQSLDVWTVSVMVEGYAKAFTVSRNGALRTIAYGRRPAQPIKGHKIVDLRSAMRLTTGRVVVDTVERYWVSDTRAERVAALKEVQPTPAGETTPPPVLPDGRNEVQQERVDRKPCPRCHGNGFVGRITCTCFRCRGKGYQTAHDERVNALYDKNHPKPRPKKAKAG